MDKRIATIPLKLVFVQLPSGNPKGTLLHKGVREGIYEMLRLVPNQPKSGTVSPWLREYVREEDDILPKVE